MPFLNPVVVQAGEAQAAASAGGSAAATQPTTTPRAAG